MLSVSREERAGSGPSGPLLVQGLLSVLLLMQMMLLISLIARFVAVMMCPTSARSLLLGLANAMTLLIRGLEAWHASPLFMR